MWNEQTKHFFPVVDCEYKASIYQSEFFFVFFFTLTLFKTGLKSRFSSRQAGCGKSQLVRFNSKWSVAKQTKLKTKSMKTIQREFACGPLKNGLSQNALTGLLSWMFVQIISHVYL